MKRIKEFLDFLTSVHAVWKIIFPIILFLIAVAGNIIQIGKQTVQVELPIWIIVCASLLSIYLIVDFLVLFHTSRKANISLYGLHWKKPFFSFGYPKPYCPHENCGRQVLCRVRYPKRVQVLSPVSDPKHIDLENHYYYECPFHGRIFGVPDESVSVLQEKVKLANKK